MESKSDEMPISAVSTNAKQAAIILNKSFLEPDQASDPVLKKDLSRTPFLGTAQSRKTLLDTLDCIYDNNYKGRQAVSYPYSQGQIDGRMFTPSFWAAWRDKDPDDFDRLAQQSQVTAFAFLDDNTPPVLYQFSWTPKIPTNG